MFDMPLPESLQVNTFNFSNLLTLYTLVESNSVVVKTVSTFLLLCLHKNNLLPHVEIRTVVIKELELFYSSISVLSFLCISNACLK